MSVCEFNSSGTLTATNTFGKGGLVSRRTLTGTPATTFYTFDERGNVTQRTTSTGMVASTDLYDGYGSRSSTGGSDVWGFEGKFGYYTDSETSLLLCKHRFYDPVTGRFLMRDPLGYDGGVNLYGYTWNDPVNRADASGYNGQETDCSGPAGEAGASGGCTSETSNQNPEENNGENSPTPTVPGSPSYSGVPSGSGGGGSTGGGGGTIYVPSNPFQQQPGDGQKIPLPDPNANGAAHTTLGYHTSDNDGVTYRMSATFSDCPTWPQANGSDVPWSRVDWHDHSMPWNHTDPHQHVFGYTPSGWRHGGQETFPSTGELNPGK